MPNQYYVIQLPTKTDDKKLMEFLQKFSNVFSRTRDKVQCRYSRDGKKIIVQGDVSPVLQNFIKNKDYITYLGLCLENGQAEKKVIDYIRENRVDWGSSEDDEQK